MGTMNTKSTTTTGLDGAHFDVLILGAGISGISAAHYLWQKQHQTDICSAETAGRPLRIGLIEAQERIGGRIYTKDFGRGYVELGANWCHGANQANCIFNLANTYDLIERPVKLFDRGVGAFLHSSGNAICQELAKNLYEELKVIEYSTVKLNPESEKRTLDEYLNDQVVALKAKHAPSVHRLIDAAVTYAKKYIQLHGGDCVKLQSAWGYGAYNEIAGDVTIRGGYRSLLTRMLADMEQKVSLHLNETVLHIDWYCQPIVVQTSRATYTADYVLVTFSLGVLKACHQTIFRPTLPPHKVTAIQNMGFGRIAKIYLEYERPFWQPGTLNCLKFYPDAEDQQQISQRKENPNEFIKYINGFEEIPTSSNVLLAWITGEDTSLLEHCSTEYIAQQCTDLLRIYTGDLSIPRPKSVLVSNWNSNPFIRGSYSYPSMSTVSRNDFNLLAEPLSIDGQQKVFFAGEATHPFYYSAVHGARQTGLNAADAIFNSWLNDTFC